MRITMVKKRLASGAPCKKCQQAEDMLRRRGLWERIDEVVVADETDPISPGMVLGRKHAVTLAPFFVVTEDDGSETVFTSAPRLAKERLRDDASRGDSAGSTEAAPALDHVALEVTYASQPPQEILGWALRRWGARCVIAFSGAEDVVLIDMATKLGLDFSVLCLDTGRLHPETYRFIDKVRVHYGIEIQVQSPQAIAVEQLVRKKGLFSFYDDGHHECCGVRKVEPLARALRGYSAWVTGQRIDQSPATRSDLEVIALDEGHEGVAGKLTKVNPLVHWTSDQVWQYIRSNGVPYNELHERGFRSIGCEPCTRATSPSEHERAGRWWWEDATKRECGLHLTPPPAPDDRP